MRRRDTGAALAWVPLRPAPPPLRDAPALRPRQRNAAHAWREIRIGVRRYRRLIRAGAVAVVVAIALSRLAPNPAATTTVVVAARDLPAGEVLTAADLRTIGSSPAAVPVGAVTDLAAVVGSQLSAPLRRNEQLTDVRLNDGVLRRPAPGLVSTPVRLADSEAALLLVPGQRIDVLAASTDTDAGGTAVGPSGSAGLGDAGLGDTESGDAGAAAIAAAAIVAANVMVVAIPTASAPAGASDATGDVGVEGTLVVLATSTLQARQLAQAEVSSRLSAVVVG